MTTVMASFIAIVLFGMIMIATISYGDSLGMMAATDSVALSQRIQSAAEIVAQVQTETGSRPRSAADLVAAGMPASTAGSMGDLDIQCTNQTCTPMALCLVLPATSDNITAARAAAGRVKGTVSGTCGAAGDPADQVVITLNI